MLINSLLAIKIGVEPAFRGKLQIESFGNRNSDIELRIYETYNEETKNKSTPVWPLIQTSFTLKQVFE